MNNTTICNTLTSYFLSICIICDFCELHELLDSAYKFCRALSQLLEADVAGIVIHGDKDIFFSVPTSVFVVSHSLWSDSLKEVVCRECAMLKWSWSAEKWFLYPIYTFFWNFSLYTPLSNFDRSNFYYCWLLTRFLVNGTHILRFCIQKLWCQNINSILCCI